MRLGELLVEQGLVTSEQVEQGLVYGRQTGMRLGSSLVELGFVDLDTLARVLSAQQGVPAVLKEHVEAIEPSVLALMPARAAITHYAIPLGQTESTPARLVVALRDPAGTPLDELAFVVGARVEAGVAPELLVLRCLEHYYGMKAERRAVGSVEEYATLDELSPALDAISPVQPKSTKLRSARPSSMPSTPPVLEPPEMLEMPEEPPPSSKMDIRMAEIAALEQAIEEERAAEELEAVWDDVPTSLLEAPPSEPGVLRPVLSVDEAIAAMHAVGSRGDVGETLATWLESTFGLGLVLIAKDGMALGWKGYVPDVDREIIESVAMPLGPASMLTVAYERMAPFVGAPPAEGAALQSRLWKLLRSAPPEEVAVAPVVLGGRVVNLLYAHPEEGTAIPPGIEADLQRIALAASEAYLRLIRGAKIK
jgi:hypothetical protein